MCRVGPSRAHASRASHAAVRHSTGAARQGGGGWRQVEACAAGGGHQDAGPVPHLRTADPDRRPRDRRRQGSRCTCARSSRASHNGQGGAGWRGATGECDAGCRSWYHSRQQHSSGCSSFTRHHSCHATATAGCGCCGQEGSWGHAEVERGTDHPAAGAESAATEVGVAGTRWPVSVHWVQ